MTLLVSGAGVAIAFDLVKDAHSVLSGGLATGFFCGAGGRSDCTLVAAHDSGWLLGLPVAAWGLAYFIVVTGLATAALVLREGERAAACSAGATLCTAGLVFDLYLGWAMVAQVGSVCIKCVLTYVCNLLLVACFVWLGSGFGRPALWSKVLPSWAGFRAPGDEAYFRSVTKAWIVGSTLLALTWTLSWVVRPFQEVREYADREAKAFLRSTLLGPPDVDMRVFEGQPSLGPEHAEVVVAVLADFQCVYCRALARHIEELRRRHPNELRVVFVNSPISSTCNPAIEGEKNEETCWLASAGECTGLQGRFWSFHDLLYKRMTLGHVRQKTVMGRLAEIDLDPRTFDRCMEEGRGARLLAQDVSIVSGLGLKRVPSLVINGYVKAGTLFPWSLRRVVRTMLEQAG